MKLEVCSVGICWINEQCQLMGAIRRTDCIMPTSKVIVNLVYAATEEQKRKQTTKQEKQACRISVANAAE